MFTNSNRKTNIFEFDMDHPPFQEIRELILTLIRDQNQNVKYSLSLRDFPTYLNDMPI